MNAPRLVLLLAMPIALLTGAGHPPVEEPSDSGHAYREVVAEDEKHEGEAPAEQPVGPLAIGNHVETAERGRFRIVTEIRNVDERPIRDLVIRHDVTGMGLTWDGKGDVITTTDADKRVTVHWSRNIGTLAPGEAQRFDLPFGSIRPVVHDRLGYRAAGFEEVVEYPFRLRIEVDPPPFVQVLPTGWSFQYTRGDHHLEHHRLRIEDVVFDDSTGNTSWRTAVRFSDENDDDDYVWAVSHGILTVQDGYVHRVRKTGLRDTAEGRRPNTFQSDDLVGLQSATVALTGWYFNWVGSVDRHVGEIRIQLEDVEFNPARGTISWTARSAYKDRHEIHEYWWGYDCVVIGLKDGAVRNGVHISPVNFEDSQRRVRSVWNDGFQVTSHLEKDVAELRGFTNHFAVLQGWACEYPSGVNIDTGRPFREDHHVKAHVITLRAARFHDNGFSVCTMTACRDDSGNSTFNTCTVALLGAEGAGVRPACLDGFLIHDGGGSDDRSFSVAIDDLD